MNKPSAEVLNLKSCLSLWVEKKKKFCAFRYREERRRQTCEVKDEFRSEARLSLDSCWRDFSTETSGEKANQSRTGVIRVCEPVFSLGRPVFILALFFNIIRRVRRAVASATEEFVLTCSVKHAPLASYLLCILLSSGKRITSCGRSFHLLFLPSPCKYAQCDLILE